MPKIFLETLQRKPTVRKPIWLMRQAGRYLPDYRAVRQQAGSFLELCLNPDLAAEVTLQPIRHFGMDAAIIFADILLVPYALGLNLTFQEGEGPVLPPCRDASSLKDLHWQFDRVAAVAASLQRVKAALPDETALIGFAGSPWTVACYMLEGHGKTGFPTARALATTEPQLVQELLEILHHATLDYLLRQIAAGAECLQLFDSWAGLLTDDADFNAFVIQPTRRLVTALREQQPDLPIIGFPRGATLAQYRRYARETGITMLGLDQNLTLAEAQQLQNIIPVQGNLDPAILVRGGDELTSAVDALLNNLGSAHVVNLGHGVVPETPPAHVKMMVAQVKNFRH